MKKLLILSDSHGAAGCLDRALEAEAPVDALFFLGDGARDLARMKVQIPAVYGVRGNCDPDSKLPVLGETEIDGLRILYLHGHLLGVKRSIAPLLTAAAQKGAGLVLYGHTHRAALFPAAGEQGAALFNPGPALEGCYGVVTIRDGQPSFELKKLP